MWPNISLSWRIFHVLLRRIYNLLLLNGTFCVCLWGLHVLKYVQVQMFLYWFYLDDLSVVESVILRCPAINVLLCISLPSGLLIFALYIQVLLRWVHSYLKILCNLDEFTSLSLYSNPDTFNIFYFYSVLYKNSYFWVSFGFHSCGISFSFLSFSVYD